MTVDKIDLTRHAVIEASAGTGKTYTIEQLVLRLLIETKTPLEKILLVTFTDKAAGDLRKRLRDNPICCSVARVRRSASETILTPLWRAITLASAPDWL